jgi:hypothetical protein
MRRPVSPVAPLSSGPVPLAEFWSDLRIQTWTPNLGGDGTRNTTAGGEEITARWGAQLWRFDVTLAPMYTEDADIVGGRLDLFGDGVATFLAFPPFNAYPARDPLGLLHGAATPVISSLPAGGKTLTITGLPGNYLLTAGDYLSFTRGSPARYELHKLVTGGRASAGGVSPVLQVVPPIRPGAAPGAAVTLRKPVMRAKIVPGSLRLPSRGLGAAQGPSFQVMQTLQKAES